VKQARFRPSGFRDAPRREPGLADVERALERTGTSRGLIERVLEQVARGSHRGAYALDRAAALLGAAVPIAPSPKVSRGGGGPCVVALVGERGSGVTTTVTKLAGKLVKSGRRVALVDLRAPGDGGGGGDDGPTARGLAADARVLQVPLDEVREADELTRVLARSRAFDAVLVDGTGVAGRDVALLRELRARAPGLRLEVYLTLPATAYRGELDALAVDHAAAGCTGLCLTRLDDSRTPAPALEHALDTRRPLALFCDGTDVSGHLRRPTPDRIADLFLRGRMA
jgi:flagellar biosynthesis protein FlhF